MINTIMIVPVPINWEARVWEKRYNKAMAIVKLMLEEEMGFLTITEKTNEFWKAEAVKHGLVFNEDDGIGEPELRRWPQRG